MGKTIHKGAEEARNQLPEILDAAANGATTIIARRGRPVAALIPVAELTARGAQKSLLSLRGSGRGLWGKRPGGAIAKLRDEWER